MNGLAQLAAELGDSVTGSDRSYTPGGASFSWLEELGVAFFPQDGSGITLQTGRVVYSTAIEADNADLVAARTLGIPLYHRADFLKELIGNDEVIAVAGTAGKTTTTGLLGWIFECLGKDPTVYNGAGVLNWKEASRPGNVRMGNSGLWIIEADESDKSFLTFHPSHSVITNISKDHFELDQLHNMFDQFESQTAGLTIRGSSGAFAELEVNVPMMGRHNLDNARCAAKLCLDLGMSREAVFEAIGRFEGIERRLEIAGNTHGITIIDDYAHNPAKIGAALRAVSETYACVHAFWRPHGFTPLAQGMDGLVEAFSSHWQAFGGTIHILPVYYAGGTVERKTTSEELVERLNSAGIPASYVPDYDVLQDELEARAQPGDAILGMGARDPELPLFARKLVEEWKKSRS